MLTKLAAQHNRQRKTKSISDARYEFRWDKINAAAPADLGEPATWLLIGENGEAVHPLVDALTALGRPHRILGLPASDTDEQELTVALHAAAGESPTLRIVHVAALGADAGAVDAVAVAGATHGAERNPAALPRRGRR